jgi:hypothetical protein
VILAGGGVRQAKGVPDPRVLVVVHVPVTVVWVGPPVAIRRSACALSEAAGGGRRSGLSPVRRADPVGRLTVHACGSRRDGFLCRLWCPVDAGTTRAWPPSRPWRSILSGCVAAPVRSVRACPVGRRAWGPARVRPEVRTHVSPAIGRRFPSLLWTVRGARSPRRRVPGGSRKVGPDAPTTEPSNLRSAAHDLDHSQPSVGSDIGCPFRLEVANRVLGWRRSWRASELPGESRRRRSVETTTAGVRQSNSRGDRR